MSLLQQAPRFDAARAADVAREHYGVEGTVRVLPSERDQNFLIERAAGGRFVLKIANATESRGFIEAQHAALAKLEPLGFCPKVISAKSSDTYVLVDGHLVRLVSWLPGETLGDVRWHSPALLEDLGARLGQLDRALEGFDHPAAQREFHWDLALATQTIAERLPLVSDPAMRQAIAHIVDRAKRAAPALRALPRSIIHNDANDYNVLVSGDRVTGVIDFGDMVYSFTAADPAVAMAYASLDKGDPLAAIAAIARGYHSIRPFTDEELSVVFDLACLRLSLSVCVAADQQRQRPGDEYLAISQEPIRRTLPRLAAISGSFAGEFLRTSCERRGVTRLLDPNRALEGPSPAIPHRAASETLARRREVTGGNLSIAYERPVKIVRGWMQYLFDETGRRYIDAYNNVPHVGHAHPRVCDAIDRQTRTLNTNTRYLHDNLVALADRLLATVRDPLRVCYFVNSGSEANELALRLARAHTHRQDIIVLEGAYHGNTTTLIDISPYKFDGPGGAGKREWVHVAPVPDLYRGRFRAGEPEAGERYAAAVGEIIEEMRRLGRAPAAFVAESWPSVAGQLVPPPGYLAAVYGNVRDVGGVCIADEVQTAYGRVGSHFYAFETQGVVPDILVLGKPIGNGYPLGAVVTTEPIARSFDNGMEFFSTFGGSTVSCAAGLAVLDVVRDEELQRHAERAGTYLKRRLETLMASHPIVGDVRGSGLFLGVELVKDRATREPAGSEASRTVNRMREEGILLGTEGPHHNVLKIRPPMPFTSEDADVLASTLDRVLAEIERNPR